MREKFELEVQYVGSGNFGGIFMGGIFLDIFK